MMQMSVDELRPGVVLHEGLFSAQGARLLPRGATVTEEVWRTLKQSKQGVVFVPGAGMGEEDGVEERVETGAGARPRHQRMVGLMTSEEVRIRRAEGMVRRMAEEVVAGMKAGRWEGMTRRVVAAPPVLRALLGETLAAARVPRVLPDGETMNAARGERVAIVRRMLDRAAAGGRGVGGGGVVGVAGDLVDEQIDRMGRGAGVYGYWVLSARRGGDWLAEHAYTVMALSVGMGVHLGWSREDVRAVGLAGLFVDVGMTLAPEAARAGAGSLDEVEVNAMRRHCTVSAAMVVKLEGVPESVALAAYQHHERLDGSGYPCGARGERVCDLARVVAVADAFAAGTAGRAHRVGRPGGAVLREIMRGARGARRPGGGRFDSKVVRGLVRLVGLWPAGSGVELSNGMVGVVVGEQGEGAVGRPVVRVLGRGGVGGEVVDLSEGRWRGVRVVEGRLSYEGGEGGEGTLWGG